MHVADHPLTDKPSPLGGSARPAPATARSPAPRDGICPAAPCAQILVTRVGLQIPDNITYEDWENAGSKLARVFDTSAWCLGDWIVHGQDRFRQRYLFAIKQAGLDYQTLRNYAWVARKFPPTRRRNKLSFQHHAEVASLDPADQDHWLRQAEANEWSRNALRMKVRAAASRDRRAPTGAIVVPRIAIRPRFLELWRAAAEQSCTSLENWLIATLNDAATEALGADDGQSPSTESVGVAGESDEPPISSFGNAS